MPRDRDKQRSAKVRHYQRNRAGVIERAKAFNARRRRENRDLVRTTKDQRPCFDCRIVFPHYVLEFDHPNGDKAANVADLARKPATIKALMLEISKCEIVCANCHRIRTWERGLAVEG